MRSLYVASRRGVSRGCHKVGMNGLPCDSLGVGMHESKLQHVQWCHTYLYTLATAWVGKNVCFLHNAFLSVFISEQSWLKCWVKQHGTKVRLWVYKMIFSPSIKLQVANNTIFCGSCLNPPKTNHVLSLVEDEKKQRQLLGRKEFTTEFSLFEG